MNFTDKQLADYRAFEKVRASGKYNMFDPRAKSAAGLDRDEFLFVMKNFDALRTAAKQTEVRKLSAELREKKAGAA